jgi:hypothetical protein
MSSSTQSKKELHHQAVTAAKHQNVIIRNINIGEVAHRLNVVDSKSLQSMLEFDQKIFNDPNTQYAGAFYKTSIGQWLGMVAWNSKNNQLHMLQAPKGDIVISSLLADHAISHQTQPMNVNKFLSQEKNGPNKEQQKALCKVFEPRKNGTTLSLYHYKSLINQDIQQQIKDLILSKPRETIKLYFDLEYNPLLAQSSHECKPEIHIYLSSDTAKHVCVVKPRKEHFTSKNTYLIKNQLIELQPVSKTAPRDCLLNFDVYARHKNEKDEWCLNQAGYGNLLFNSIFFKDKQLIDLNVTNSRKQDISKGTLVVSLCKKDSICQLRYSNKPHSVEEITKELESHERTIAAYIEDNRLFYNQYPATASSVQNVTVFVDQTRVGYLPGSMFDVFRVPKAREEFYLNLLEISLKRYFKIFDRTTDVIDRYWLNAGEIDPKFRSKITMRILTAYVTACPYITDEMDHNKAKQSRYWDPNLVEMIESFDNMFPRDAGDCEDFSRAILRLVCELKFHSSSFQSQAMHLVCENVDKFIFCSVLCGVSNKALTGVPKRGTTYHGKLNGHEGVFAIPKYTFYESLKRHDPNHIILQQASNVELRKGSCDSVYVLEGTGMLIPEPSADTKAEEYTEQVVSKCSEILKSYPVKHGRTYFHYDPKSKNNFYKMMITLLTPEFFMNGLPYVEFLLHYKNKNNRYGTRGVWFNDLLNVREQKDVAIAPSPQLSSNVIYSYTRIGKDQYPMTSLKKLPLSNKMLDIEKQLTFESTKKQIALDKNISQTWYIRFDAMNQSVIDGVKQICQLCGLSVRTRAEPMRINDNGHHVGCYAVEFYN